MDEELDKYMKDRMDEAVDNLVGQGVDNVDKKVDKQIIWGYIFDLLEKKQTTMRPMLLNERFNLSALKTHLKCWKTR